MFSLFQYSDVYQENSSNEERVVFDIGWDEMYRGRAIIKTCRNNDFAKNFLKLITGECGPTFKDMIWKGIGQFFLGGSYKLNNEIHEAAVFPGIIPDNNTLSRPTPGDIYPSYAYAIEKQSLFNILTSGYVNNFQYCFGKAIVGLSILQEATLYNTKIMSCGVLVPLKCFETWSR